MPRLDPATFHDLLDVAFCEQEALVIGRDGTEQPATFQVALGLFSEYPAADIQTAAQLFLADSVDPERPLRHRCDSQQLPTAAQCYALDVLLTSASGTVGLTYYPTVTTPGDRPGELKIVAAEQWATHGIGLPIVMHPDLDSALRRLDRDHVR